MVSNAGIVIVVAMMSMTVAGQGVRPQDVELQRAIRTEKIDGDELAAIRQYGELATKYATTDRSVAAQSLLRQALLYQKRGDARARSVFERVMNQYGDQSQPAAQAQRALGGTSRRMTQERISAGIGDKGADAVSPDGRWIVFASREGFIIRGNGSTRDHASVPQGDTPFFSTDSKRVVYNNWSTTPSEFRVASLDGRWNPRNVKTSPPDVRYYNPGGWSSDGQSVLVEIVHQNWTKEIAWLSLATGETRVLTTLGHRRPQDQGERLSLSPDGQWIVYSAFPADPGANPPRQAGEPDRHLYLLPARGGTPTEIVGGGVNVRPMWTPDSRRIAFVSNRSGSFGLWSIAVSGTRESPVIELPSSGRIVPMAITRNGALYFARKEAGVDLFVSDVRADGQVGTPARLATGASGGNFAPASSPDRRFTAYIRQRKDRPSAIYSLVVHSMADHSERVFDSYELAYAIPEWFDDGGRVLVTEGGPPRRRLIVNVATGTIAPAAESERPRPPVRIALPSGTLGEQRNTMLSPDGTRSASVVAERGTDTGSLWFAGADGQGARQVTAPASTWMLAWAADSRAIYFLEPRGDDSRLMRMSVDGGTPLYTGLTLPGDNRQRRATLAGSQLVFAQEAAVHELWVVKNFAVR